MVDTKDIRRGFRTARSHVPDKLAPKPSRAAVRAVAPAQATLRPVQAPPISAPASTPRAPAAPASKPKKGPCRVNAEQPSVCLPAGERYRLVIKGIGPMPARLRKKRPILDVRVMGKQYALVRWEVTVDGEAILPLSAVRVCIDLVDPAADIEVVVERRPAGARPKQAPERWRTRRTPRPTMGGYRPPKAAYRKSRRIPPRTQ